VFLAVGWESAWMWRDFIEDETGEGDISILEVNLPDELVRGVRLDRMAYDEGSVCSAYLTRIIHAKYIEVADSGLSGLR
jgi:hypothetical protein